jgi:hypothetical protein
MQALDLFSNIGEPVDEWSGSLREINFREAARAPDLTYVPEFITVEEEDRLIASIDKMAWSHEYSRRRQHYGYAYHPGGEEKVQVLPLPVWLKELAERVGGQGKMQNGECKRQNAGGKLEIGNRKLNPLQPSSSPVHPRWR